MANKSRTEIVLDLINAAESWLSLQGRAGQPNAATNLGQKIIAAEREFVLQEATPADGASQ